MNKPFYLFLLCLGAICITSCNVDEDATSSELSVQDDADASDPEVTDNNEDPNSQASASATYTVTFIGEWTAASHPNDFPENDHFSNTVLLTHNNNVRLYSLGSTASKGVEDMAEIGDNAAIISEMQEMIENDQASNFVVGSNSFVRGNGMDVLTIEATQTHSKLSYVAMIAPSPDWFTGLSAIALFENDAWTERLEVDVVAYDAGTEEGNEFRFDNPETNPQSVITRITQAPLGNGTTVEPRLGRLIIERQ